jgi:glutamine amidotransferase
MCRVLGSVAAEPVSLRHELLEADNPLIRQAEKHDSGWGLSVYKRGEGGQPRCMRFTEAAHADDAFRAATECRGRMFNVHVRRATVGGLTPENTHPFCLGNYSFSHNGTVQNYARLLMGDDVAPPHGETDSEVLFNFLMRDYDPARPIEMLRHMVSSAIATGPFSGLNFLFSDGEKLYAYRLGVFELHWLARPGQLLVASERLTDDESWHDVRQDVLLVLDPADPDEPHAERLVGDTALASAQFEEFEDGSHLSGAERGAFAAERAARTTAATAE